MVRKLETDYLVIGAGATAMAFVDEVLTESKHANVVLVDRRAKPGGHWNDAYSFVKLHQPAAFYGVNSEPLGAGGGDLASAAQILAYYERVLQRHCATGRVVFLAQCNYEGQGRVRSVLAPDVVYQVTVGRKTVDATYTNIQVPATRPPPYEVDDAVAVVPVNALVEQRTPWSRYVVIGGGKTGIDAILHLLKCNVAAEKITWIICNDAWLLNRNLLMPGLVARDMPLQLRVTSEAASCDDHFTRHEAQGWFMRLDPAVEPSRFRCATVTTEELATLRTIENIVRMGKVIRVGRTEIVLDDGVLPTATDVLHVDCTADGLARQPGRPLFEDGTITLQSLFMCQPVVSAALTAVIELRYDDDATKNALCKPVPHPRVPADYFSAMGASFDNIERWLAPFGWWTFRSRLCLLHHVSFVDLVRLIIGALRWSKPALNNFRLLLKALPHEGGRHFRAHPHGEQPSPALGTRSEPAT